MPRAQFLEPELPPVDELLLEVGLDVGEHHVARAEEHAAEHRQRQREQKRRRQNRLAPPAGRTAAARRGRISAGPG